MRIGGSAGGATTTETRPTNGGLPRRPSVQADLGLFDPAGRVLELACRTGLWTERLAAVAEHVTALDSAPEAMEIARAKVDATNVDFIEADLFQWEPEQAYDVCFFAFWLSHVPQERVREFWEKVRRGLAPGGRVYLVDSARSERASARDHTLQDPDQQLTLRRLSDGREYRIVKHWFDAPALQRQLTRARLGCRHRGDRGVLHPRAGQAAGVRCRVASSPAEDERSNGHRPPLPGAPQFRAAVAARQPVGSRIRATARVARASRRSPPRAEASRHRWDASTATSVARRRSPMPSPSPLPPVCR